MRNLPCHVCRHWDGGFMRVRTTCVPTVARTTSGALARDRLAGTGRIGELRSTMAMCRAWTCLACMLFSAAVLKAMLVRWQRLLTAAVSLVQRKQSSTMYMVPNSAACMALHGCGKPYELPPDSPETPRQ